LSSSSRQGVLELTSAVRTFALANTEPLKQRAVNKPTQMLVIANVCWSNGMVNWFEKLPRCERSNYLDPVGWKKRDVKILTTIRKS
jgi:hypothetical protein